MPGQTATDYSIDHGAAIEGAVVDNQLSNKISRLAEVAIGFGRFVRRGTQLDRECALPTVTGNISADALLGVAVRVQDHQANASDVLQYEIGRDVGIMRSGSIWVFSETSFIAGNTPFIVHTGAGAGRIRSDADGGNATDATGLLHVMSTIAAAGLVQISVNF